MACLFPLSAPGQYAGTGEPNDPYQIGAAEQLTSIGSDPNLWDKHYILTRDIDLSPSSWLGRPVFHEAVIGMFSGTFDGNDFAVRCLTIVAPQCHDERVEPLYGVGLFGALLAGAEVRNLTVQEAAISGNACTVGALVGCNAGGKIINCRSTGSVVGQRSLGGLVGRNEEFGLVENCSSICTVRGWSLTGGLVGDNDRSSIVGSASDGEVTGDHGSAGGLVARNRFGKILNCRSHCTCRAWGGNAAGGLVGENSGGTIINSWCDGAVKEGAFMGGFVGQNSWGCIVNCFSMSEVGTSFNGGGAGFLEFNQGTLINCYSAGKVHGNGSGFVRSAPDSEIVHCFWDIEASGQSDSAAGVGLSTERMKLENTFLDEGWDFVGEQQNGLHEIWQMSGSNGYPTLTVFDDPSPMSLDGEGTSESPYLISTPAELGAILHHDSSARYLLTQNVDLSGIVWSLPVIPILAGVLDGNKVTVSNMTLTGCGDLGLIGEVRESGQVEGVSVVDAKVVAIGPGNHSVGLLVGYSNGCIVNSFSSCGAGSVEMSWSAGPIGGLVGSNNGCISRSCSVCDLYGWDWIGGLAGINGGIISNCYSRGRVIGRDRVGGLVGLNEGSIATSYSAARVAFRLFQTRPGEIGPLVGANEEGSVEASFWDREVCSLSSTAGIGLTTAEMKTTTSYTGWDFVGETANGTEDIWWILEGQDYPRLWWQAVEKE